MHVSRRSFLSQGATAAAVALTAMDAVGAQILPKPAGRTSEAATIPGRDTTLKFDTNGAVRPFAGNTVICHLPAQCAMRDVMSEFHDKLKVSPFRGSLGLTTVDSYHMTIFPGANDQGRKASGWPSYVPLDASIQDCDAAVEKRMRAVSLHCELPFRVAVDVPATLSYPRACTLRMKAINAAEEAKLRSVRDQLAQVYGFRLPDHSTYVFHITMSYQVAAFTESEQRLFQTMRSEYVQKIVAAQPVLELGNPEFCTFQDMFRFEPRLLLRTDTNVPAR